MKRPVGRLVVFLCVLAGVPATFAGIAQAHHVVKQPAPQAVCLASSAAHVGGAVELTFSYDADAGAWFRFDVNQDQLIKYEWLVGRGTATVDFPASVLSATAATSIKITASPALDEGFDIVTTSGPCLTPPPPPPVTTTTTTPPPTTTTTTTPPPTTTTTTTPPPTTTTTTTPPPTTTTTTTPPVTTTPTPPVVPPKPKPKPHPKPCKVLRGHVHAHIGPQGISTGNAILHETGASHFTLRIFRGATLTFSSVFHVSTVPLDVRNPKFWGLNSACGCTYSPTAHLVLTTHNRCSSAAVPLTFNNQDAPEWFVRLLRWWKHHHVFVGSLRTRA